MVRNKPKFEASHITNRTRPGTRVAIVAPWSSASNSLESIEASAGCSSAAANLVRFSEPREDQFHQLANRPPAPLGFEDDPRGRLSFGVGVGGSDSAADVLQAFEVVDVVADISDRHRVDPLLREPGLQR